MEGIETLGQQLAAAHEQLSPDPVSGVGATLESAAGVVNELLDGSEAGERIAGHLSEAQERMADAIGHLTDARSSLGAYLTSIGYGDRGPGAADYKEPVPAPRPTALESLVERQAAREAEYAAYNARLAAYYAVIVEGARGISEIVDAEILPEWSVNRETLIEQLAVSPPARIEVRHWHNSGRYEVTAKWAFRDGDFDDQTAPTAQIIAYSSILEEDIGPLVDALQLLRKPQHYRLPKRRGPYNVPVVWDDEIGRFSYPPIALWTNVARQLASSAHRIDAFGNSSGVSGTIIENSSDLTRVASDLRVLATKYDLDLALRSELSKVHTDGPEGKVQYLRQRYVDAKRVEIDRTRKIVDLIDRGHAEPGDRGIEIREIRY
ncbi:MAG TPA: hypothetical protein VLH86_00385 [Patescibacteria group bacterium]|nr:hypothetical protein [Patescibacteria group bacterium]